MADFGIEQESLQALLANIISSNPKDDEQQVKKLQHETPEASPGSAYLSCSSADFSLVPPLPSSQCTSTSQRSELEKDNSFDAIFRSLQSSAQPHSSSNQPPSNDIVDVVKNPQGQAQEVPTAQAPQSVAVEDLIISFMGATQQNNATTNSGRELNGNPSNLIVNLLKSVATRGQQQQQQQQQPKSANDLLQQLLLNQVQQQKQQEPLSLPNAGDPLSSLIGAVQQHNQQGNVTAAQRVESTDSFASLLGGQGGCDRLGSQKASPGLGNLVNQLLSSRDRKEATAEEEPRPDLDFDAGFLTIPGCDNDQEEFEAGLLQTNDGSRLQQQTPGSSGSPLLGCKRMLEDGGQECGPPTKERRSSDVGEEDAARQQHLQKLQEQSQTLKTANVMLSKYLDGLQANLSEILAENWSFKILIGCLTSRKQSTNPLEQMISAKIASNPSVAIPMLKSIHMSAANNASSQEKDTAASSKDSVFQNMVNLLSAQKQVPSS